MTNKDCIRRLQREYQKLLKEPSSEFVALPNPENILEWHFYSDFHPETWNPMWNVSTILTGLVSFMTSSEESVGTVVTADGVKRVYAKASMEFNLKNPSFRKFFESRCQDHVSQASSPVASSSAPKNVPASSSSAPPSTSTSAKHRTHTDTPQKAVKAPINTAVPAQQAQQILPPKNGPQVAATPSKSKPNTSLAIFIMLIIAGLAITLNRML